MHDGHFTTRKEVIDFYSERVVNMPLSDPLIKSLQKGCIHLTKEEKASLKAFLLTLSDKVHLSDQSLACHAEPGMF